MHQLWVFLNAQILLLALSLLLYFRRLGDILHTIVQSLRQEQYLYLNGGNVPLRLRSNRQICQPLCSNRQICQAMMYYRHKDRHQLPLLQQVRKIITLYVSHSHIVNTYNMCCSFYFADSVKPIKSYTQLPTSILILSMSGKANTPLRVFPSGKF